MLHEEFAEEDQPFVIYKPKRGKRKNLQKSIILSPTADFDKLDVNIDRLKR